MKRVYMVKAVKSYEIEIIANSEDEAYDYANEQPLSEWTGCDFEMVDAQLVSNDANEYYSPDTNEERWGIA